MAGELNGMRVAVIQFVKGKWQTGERVALERFADQVSINTMGAELASVDEHLAVLAATAEGLGLTQA